MNQSFSLFVKGYHLGRRRWNTGLTKIRGKMHDGKLLINSVFELVEDDIITIFTRLVKFLKNQILIFFLFFQLGNENSISWNS